MKREFKIFMFLALPVIFITYVNKVRWDNLLFISNRTIWGKFILFMTDNVIGVIISFFITYILVRLIIFFFQNYTKKE